MAKCPNCGESIKIDVAACSHCPAVFEAGGWHPLPTEADEAALYPNVEAENPRAPGGAFILKAGVAIALLPIIPLCLTVLILSSCSSFGWAFGFRCSGASGIGDGTWTSDIAVMGTLGWFFAVPTGLGIMLLGALLIALRI